MKKILLMGFVFCFIFATYAKEQNAANFGNFRFPEFDKDTGQLKFIIYGAKAVTVDVFVEMDDVVLDFIKEEIKETSQVKEYENIEIYSLNTESQKIVKFWEDKIHTKQFIKAGEALYDKATQFVKGKKKIELRSLDIDIDGIGFDLNSTEKVLNIYSDVKVNLRNAKIDPITKKTTYTTTQIFSDELKADFGSDKIVFSKNVVVIDNKSTINCEEMILHLNEEENNNDIKKAICKQNVIITRQLKNIKQVATAEVAKYDLEKGVIDLITNPKITSNEDIIIGDLITLYRDVDQIEVNDNAYLKSVKIVNNKRSESIITSDFMTSDMQKNIAEFKGNVKFKDGQSLVNCDYIIMNLAESKKKKENSGIEKITCHGNVIILKMENGKLIASNKAVAKKAIYEVDKKILTLYENPILYRNEDIIKGDKIVVYEGSDRIMVYDNVNLKLKSFANNNLSKTNIFANFADINMFENITILNKNVRVLDKENGNLTCENLTLHFKEVNQKGEKEKVLEKVKAKEDVFIERKNLPNSVFKNEIIKCQSMDLLFKQINGKNKIKVAELFKKVFIDRIYIDKNKSNETYKAEIFEYDAEKERIVLTEKASIVQGKEIAQGEKIILFRKNNNIEKMRITDNAKIEVLTRGEKTVITADYIDMNSSKNKITCNDNVVSIDKYRTIKADTMFIYTEEIAKTKKKEINKIICLDNVFVSRKITNAETGRVQIQNSESGKADFNAKTGDIVLTDEPLLYRGKEKIRAVKMIMNNKSNDVEIIGNVSGEMKYK